MDFKGDARYATKRQSTPIEGRRLRRDGKKYIKTMQDKNTLSGMINALFVETHGPYFELPWIEPWDKERNAMNCQNGAPAVAHPPCERWGRYWSGGPSAKIRRKLGDDGGCFAFALWYIRTFGGVLEHPEASHAFKFYGLPIPAKSGGWTESDRYGGRSCCVEQGHYGHPARKATWLYACKTEFPELRWGPCEKRLRMDEGFRSKEAAKEARARADFVPVKRLTEFERLATPPEFRDLLIEIAKTAR
jgi:hypothetical protein